LLVDTGSEYTWVPGHILERIRIQREKKDVAFVLANGQHVTRNVGFAIIRLDKFFTIDEVVFAEKGDLLLLGARTLEGLSLTIDPSRKKLVAAGPVLAASSTAATPPLYRVSLRSPPRFTLTPAPVLFNGFDLAKCSRNGTCAIPSSWPSPSSLRRRAAECGAPQCALCSAEGANLAKPRAAPWVGEHEQNSKP